jgi:serine/threonine protein phosphatase PrpC
MSIGQVITSAAMSDKGNVREVNEDSYLERPEVGLWVVADGMGGHAAGDVASQAMVAELNEVDLGGTPGEYLDQFDDAVEAVNRRLYEMSLDDESPKLVGTTLASLIAMPGHCVIAWVGDSRVYRYRNGVLEQIGRDHSQVEEMIEQGTLSRKDAEAHPDANVITRAVGGQSDVIVDMTIEAVEDDDRYLLCSDGLFKDITEQEIAPILADGDCKTACQNLVNEALQRECNDNVTVVVVDFQGRERANSDDVE